MSSEPTDTALDSEGLYLGEWSRSIDDRFRLSLPVEWVPGLTDELGQCVLAKERPGCVSVWNSQQWESWLADGVDLVRSKIRSGRLAGRLDQVQRLGRLLSTRHRSVPIAGRGRLAIPDSFREFLEVEPGENVMVVGAAVCVEIWQPRRWSEHIGQQMPEFRELLDQLAD
ncbi:MAG: division/cell wall cluster transcriptional repressor MraZ [Planctomycetes bacterium]|nr:division/cell wall cluster transcriptional repressor MraZ [Planctomycetota bacterium]